MSAVTAARFGFKYGWTLGENGWNTGVDYNFAAADAYTGLYLVSDTTDTPPGSPADGDAYYVPAGATGTWTTYTGKIAAYQNGGWKYYPTSKGLRAYIEDRDGFYFYSSGGAWQAEAATFTSGVTSVNGQTGPDVTLAVADIEGAAPLDSPFFTGTPEAPTQTAGDNSQALATTAYVDEAVALAGAATYTLPAATVSDLGGVKVGSGLSVDGDGLLSVSYSYTLPTASNTVKGGIKIGTGLAIDGGGVVSVSYAYSLPIADGVTLGGIIVGSGLSIDGSGVLSATYSYSLPAASSTVLGGIKVGSGLAIDGSNVLSVTVAGGATAMDGLSDVTLTTPADGDRLHYDAGTSQWINGREPYVVAGFVPGILTASQLLLQHRFAEAVTFPANWGTATSGGKSYVEVTSNAAGSTTLTIYKCASASDPTVGGNWSSVGTAVIASSGHLATLTTSGGSTVSFAQGDRMRVSGPSTADTTAANFMLTFAGDR